MRQLSDQLAGEGNPQRGDRVGIMPFGADAATLAGGSPAAAPGLIVQHGRRGQRGKNGSARPSENNWLSPSEGLRLNRLRLAKRRADWRLGRWTAKRALSAYLKVPPDPDALREIEIFPAPSGAPEVFITNKPAGVSISLRHRSGVAVCAVASGAAALGCDGED